MTALLQFFGFGALFLGVVAFLDTGNSRWIGVALVAGGVAALVLARILAVYFRYREAFVAARRGARRVAREHRRQGYIGYVPRSREALFVRRFLPGAAR